MEGHDTKKKRKFKHLIHTIFFILVISTFFILASDLTLSSCRLIGLPLN